MKKEIARITIFLLMMFVLIIIIKVLNWVPIALQKDVMKQYASIDEMKSHLKMTDIYLPAYFPGEFTWPPSTILGQNVPFPAVVLEFKMRDKDAVGLIITQSSSPRFHYGKKMDILSEAREKSYSLEGRDMKIVYGKCSMNEICSNIKWKEKNQFLTIFAMVPHQELVRIAESMFPH